MIMRTIGVTPSDPWPSQVRLMVVALGASDAEGVKSTVKSGSVELEK